MGTAARSIAIVNFLAGVCLVILLARPVAGVGPAWPVNGLIAIAFVTIVVFGWRVWEAVRRFRRGE